MKILLCCSLTLNGLYFLLTIWIACKLRFALRESQRALDFAIKKQAEKKARLIGRLEADPAFCAEIEAYLETLS